MGMEPRKLTEEERIKQQIEGYYAAGNPMLLGAPNWFKHVVNKETMTT